MTYTNHWYIVNGKDFMYLIFIFYECKPTLVRKQCWYWNRLTGPQNRLISKNLMIISWLIQIHWFYPLVFHGYSHYKCSFSITMLVVTRGWYWSLVISKKHFVDSKGENPWNVHPPITTGIQNLSPFLSIAWRWDQPLDGGILIKAMAAWMSQIYHLLIQHGWLEDPRTFHGGFYITRNITDRWSMASSQLCLMTGG